MRIASAGTRRGIRAKLPPSKLGETLDIATWNVRELGKKKRLEPSLHSIAEILGQFDLVSLVELRDDTSGLAEVSATSVSTGTSSTRTTAATASARPSSSIGAPSPSPALRQTSPRTA